MGKALKQQTVIENNKNIIMEKEIRFQDYSEIEAKKLFMEMRHRKKIIEGGYYDNKWILMSRFKDETYTLHFGYLSETMKRKVKKYTLLLLEKMVTQTVYHYVNFLIKIISVTKEFTDDSSFVINTIKEYRKDASMVSAVEDFFVFIDIKPQQIRIIDHAIKENIIENNIRKLPTFQSVLCFEMIINDLIKEGVPKEYYPIVLWWKLTMVIPMRPIEFFTLKNTSFYEKDSEFYVSVERSLKSDPEDKVYHDIGLITEFRIEQNLYQLFDQYIKMIRLGPEGFIFNVVGKRLQREREYIGTSAIQGKLEKFYKMIVHEKYNYTIVPKGNSFLKENEIEKINLGDTRHLSFLNLILSGYNPYTIAQLGGHRTLEAQMSYYSGATSYCTSKAFSLALGIKDLDINSSSIELYRKQQYNGSVVKTKI